MKNLLTAVVMFSVLSIAAGTLQFECSTNRKDAIYKAFIPFLNSGSARSDRCG